MAVLVAKHPASLAHDTGPMHPERPERVLAVEEGIATSGLEVVELEASKIERTELAVVHDADYIEMIESYSSMGGGAFDSDTVTSSMSWEAALRSAGAVRLLTEQLSARDDAFGFALCRPPGHHALAARAMGFCLFNNIAVTAALLRSQGERVAILDWDVHHGNGTQALLHDDPGVLYVSLHQSAFYPFEGFVGDIDDGSAKGTTVNVPLPAGTGGDVYREAWTDLVLPVLDQFGADWVLISAGYDAHRDDPLADMSLTAADYGFMAHRLSQAHPMQRTVVVLEGGYDLDALRDSAQATVVGLSGSYEGGDAEAVSPHGARAALERSKEVVSRHWSL